MGKYDTGVVMEKGRYLGEINAKSPAQVAMAQATLKTLEEVQLNIANPERSAKELYDQYQSADIPAAERQAVADMLGNAIRIIGNVGELGADQKRFAEDHGARHSSMRNPSDSGPFNTGIFDNQLRPVGGTPENQ